MRTVFKIIIAVLAVIVIFGTGVVADANLEISSRETLAPDFGAPGRFVTVDGHKLHVATIGDIAKDPSGAPLLLLHGFLAPGHVTWLPWANRLTPQRALILPDLLGFGHSERVTQPGAYYTLKEQAASLATILDALGVTQVDIVGESYGGAVAAQFAAEFPERVRRVVFMDAAIYAQPALARVATVPLGIGRAIVWHVLGGGPFGFIAQNCKDQPSCRWMRLAHVTGTTDALIAMLTTRRQTPDDANLPQRLSKITARSLVIWGGNDTVVPVTDGDRLALALKSTIAIVAGAGHLPYLDQPEKVAQRILDFLQPAP